MILLTYGLGTSYHNRISLRPRRGWSLRFPTGISKETGSSLQTVDILYVPSESTFRILINLRVGNGGALPIAYFGSAMKE